MGPLCGKCKWAQQPRSYMKSEKCLRCEGGETALVVSILVLGFAIPSVVAIVLWRFTRARALTYRIYRRVFDIGRFKVVWVNYQIMATVGWNVQIVFPEPFATFERLLSVLDLSLLRIMPISCMLEYDFLTDFYVVVLIPLIVAGVIIVVGVARIAHHPAKRAQISYLHSSLLLLLSFLVLPATSMKVRAV